MSKKKKIIIAVSAVVILIISSFAIFFSDPLLNYMFDRFVITMGPDTSDWALENDEYTVIPVLTEETVTFYVENKTGNTVFTCEEIWRDWDFKRIDIDENNIITADSSDLGIFIYKEDENGSFYLVDPIGYSGYKYTGHYE